MIQIHNPTFPKQWLNLSHGCQCFCLVFWPSPWTRIQALSIVKHQGSSISEGPHRLLEEKDRWGQWPRKVQLEKYLSWVIKQPLFPGLLLVGGYSFCHLMPHSGFHVTKHMVQPYLHLEGELWVRHHKTEKVWSILFSFTQPEGVKTMELQHCVLTRCRKARADLFAFIIWDVMSGS